MQFLNMTIRQTKATVLPMELFAMLCKVLLALEATTIDQNHTENQE